MKNWLSQYTSRNFLDLDDLKSVRLKKETFIKIVLPLIVAENEKILDDRKKLTLSEKNTPLI